MKLVYNAWIVWEVQDEDTDRSVDAEEPMPIRLGSSTDPAYLLGTLGLSYDAETQVLEEKQNILAALKRAATKLEAADYFDGILKG